jgi:mRNA interferase MazF
MLQDRLKVTMTDRIHIHGPVLCHRAYDPDRAMQAGLRHFERGGLRPNVGRRVECRVLQHQRRLAGRRSKKDVRVGQRQVHGTDGATFDDEGVSRGGWASGRPVLRVFEAAGPTQPAQRIRSAPRRRNHSGVYASKPRPALILQAGQFSETGSITVVPCTTDPTEAPLFRLVLEPDAENGLRARCRLMIDKIATVAKANLGERIGRLDDDDLIRVNRTVVTFLGIT